MTDLAWLGFVVTGFMFGLIGIWIALRSRSGWD